MTSHNQKGGLQHCDSNYKEIQSVIEMFVIQIPTVDYSKFKTFVSGIQILFLDLNNQQNRLFAMWQLNTGQVQVI